MVLQSMVQQSMVVVLMRFLLDISLSTYKKYSITVAGQLVYPNQHGHQVQQFNLAQVYYTMAIRIILLMVVLLVAQLPRTFRDPSLMEESRGVLLEQ